MCVMFNFQNVSSNEEADELRHKMTKLEAELKNASLLSLYGSQNNYCKFEFK